MSDVIETPVPPVSDDFSAAFGQATGEPAAAPVVEEPAATLPAEPTAPVEPVVPAPTEPAPTEPAAPTEPVVPAPAEPAAPVTEPAPVSPPNLDPKYLAQAIAEAQHNLAAQQPAAPTEPAPVKTYTAEDFLDAGAKTSIEKFKAEWPDEFPAIQRMYQAEVQAQVTNAQNALIAQLNGVLAPLFQSVGKVEVNSHLGTIRTAHADFDAVLPAVAEWVTKQPSFLRAPMQGVLDKGTAQDVIDLVASYKAAQVATGAAPATPAPSAAQEPRPTPAVKAPVDPSAVAALAAVPTTQRPKPAGSADPMDFGSAFAEAEKALA